MQAVERQVLKVRPVAKKVQKIAENLKLYQKNGFFTCFYLVA